MMRKLLLTFIVYVQKVARKDLSLNYFLQVLLSIELTSKSVSYGEYSIYRKRYFWFISFILKRRHFGGWTRFHLSN